MPLGTKVGLGPANIVLEAEPAPPQGVQPPIFGWMDQDATWYGGRPRPGDFVLRGDPVPPKGDTPPFWLMSLVSKRLDGLRCHLVWRLAQVTLC